MGTFRLRAMIKVGLIGEDPNDTTAIRNLLNQKFSSVIKFTTICKNITGHGLDSGKFYRTVGVETKHSKFDIIICIRDLDAFETEVTKLRSRKEWFNKITKHSSGCQTILLLNIWEIEAILFADIAPINKMFGTKISDHRNPSTIKEPKKRLKQETRKVRRTYRESDCQELLARVDFDQVVSKCTFFSDFIDDFKSRHTALKAIR